MQRNSKQGEPSDNEGESSNTRANRPSHSKTDIVGVFQRHPRSKTNQDDPEHIQNSKEKRHKQKPRIKVIYTLQPTVPDSEDQLVKRSSSLGNDSRLTSPDRTTHQNDETPRQHKKTVKKRTARRPESVGTGKSTNRPSSTKHSAGTEKTLKKSSATKHCSERRKTAHRSPSKSHPTEDGPPSNHRSSTKDVTGMTPSSRVSPSASSLHRRHPKSHRKKRSDSVERSESTHRSLEPVTTTQAGPSYLETYPSVTSCLSTSKLQDPEESNSQHRSSKNRSREFVTLSQHHCLGSVTSHRHSSKGLYPGHVKRKTKKENSYQNENDKYDCAEREDGTQGHKDTRRRHKSKREPQIAPVHRKSKKKDSSSHPAGDVSQQHFRNDQEVVVLHATERFASSSVPSDHTRDTMEVIHQVTSSDGSPARPTYQSAFTQSLSRLQSPKRSSNSRTYEDHQYEAPFREAPAYPREETTLPTLARKISPDRYNLPTSQPRSRRRYESPSRSVRVLHETQNEPVSLPQRGASQEVLSYSPSNVPPFVCPGGTRPARPREEPPRDPQRQSSLNNNGKINPTDLSAKTILKYPKCPQRGSEHSPPKLPPNKKSKLNPSSFDYIPIWYQKAANNSNDWFDGSTYYQRMYDTSNQLGAFAPNVNVERMVQLEKAKRKVPKIQQYSNEDFDSSGKKKKKNKNMQSETYDAISTNSRDTNATNYVVNYFEVSDSSRWDSDVPTKPKDNKSAIIFDLKRNSYTPYEKNVIDSRPYSGMNAKNSKSSVYEMSSVSSSGAKGRYGNQESGATLGYDELCDCIIENCDCPYDCTSRKKVQWKPCNCDIDNCDCPLDCASRKKVQSRQCNCDIDNCDCPLDCASRKRAEQRKVKEVTTREECLNLPDLRPCPRGPPGYQPIKPTTSRSSLTKNDARDRGVLFVKRRLSDGDSAGECFCNLEDCQCIYDPCASRENGTGRKRVEKKRKKKPKKPKPVKTVDTDKCILCRVDAIEKPFSWCMRTFCITWVWSDREFIRHCGRALGPLPDYYDKHPSLKQSWVQRMWDKRYEPNDSANSENCGKPKKKLGLFRRSKSNAATPGHAQQCECLPCNPR